LPGAGWGFKGLEAGKKLSPCEFDQSFRDIDGNSCDANNDESIAAKTAGEALFREFED
jgi:hypothetical protein